MDRHDTGNFDSRQGSSSGRYGRQEPGGISSLFSQLHREFEGIMSRLQGAWDAEDEGEIRTCREEWDYCPAVDFEEHADGYELSMELPGMKAADVVVSVTDGVLRISGEKRKKREQAREGRRSHERRYGRFSRSLRLPQDADEDGIEATFEDAVLEIKIPKSTSEQGGRSRKIEIVTSSATDNPRHRSEGNLAG